MQCGYSLGDARDKLTEIWGYTDFRLAQRRVVFGALRGRDVLAVLPTGGGKSLCFQVPPLVQTALVSAAALLATHLARLEPEKPTS